MKRFLVVVVFISFSIISYAHEYYFAFAEMEYNKTSSRFELTLIVSTHDIEHWLQDKGIKVKELEDHYTDSTLQKEFGIQLLNGYSVSMNNLNIPFQITGFEVKENGLSEFYFASNTLQLSSPLLVKFDLLMDKFSEQQNKLTFINNNQKSTYPFLTAKREQLIKLEE